MSQFNPIISMMESLGLPNNVKRKEAFASFEQRRKGVVLITLASSAIAFILLAIQLWVIEYYPKNRMANEFLVVIIALLAVMVIGHWVISYPCAKKVDRAEVSMFGDDVFRLWEYMAVQNAKDLFIQFPDMIPWLEVEQRSVEDCKKWIYAAIYRAWVSCHVMQGLGAFGDFVPLLFDQTKSMSVAAQNVLGTNFKPTEVSPEIVKQVREIVLGELGVATG